MSDDTGRKVTVDTLIVLGGDERLFLQFKLKTWVIFYFEVTFNITK